MKKFINKYLFVALAAGLLASCSNDDNSWAPGEPDDANKVDVYFTAQKTNFEVAPGEPTTMEITLGRSNTSSALSVPLNVSVNEGDVFVVPTTAEFAAGAETTTVKVDFSKATVGTTYKVTVNVPAEYSYIYKISEGNMSYTGYATIVKWNLIAKGHYYTWLFEDYMEDVELYQRDDDKTQYKMVNWGISGDITYPFTMDAKGNISGQQQFYIGYDHPSYGAMWVSDDAGYSYYSEGYYVFAHKYHVAAGSFGTDYDWFVSYEIEPVE